MSKQQCSSVVISIYIDQ